MANRIEELMYEIFRLKKAAALVEASVADLKKIVADDNMQIDRLSLQLLNELTANNMTTYDWAAENLVVEKFVRENIAYTSDEDVLNYLKNNYASQYIKTKITESLDKNALKKAIKTDTKLSEALESMTVKSSTEYVVVTDSENHKKMLEHINEQKS